MTFKYFRKAHSQDKTPKPPKPEPIPEFEIHRLASGLVRRYNSMYLAKQRGRSKGGLAIARLGLAHRWTSESARRAALKRWRTRNRMNKHINKRIGLPSKNRAPVDRAVLRLQYAQHPRLGIIYCPVYREWQRLLPNGDIRPLSERWALTYLGHLGRQASRLPREVLGTANATKEST